MSQSDKHFRIEKRSRAEAGQPPGDALLASRRAEQTLRSALNLGDGLSRAASELDAVVADTARAANAILAAAEEIDSALDQLRCVAQSCPEGVADIAERTVAISMACDFQDLTGQRIANVVTLLSDLDRRFRVINDLVGAGEGRPRQPHAGQPRQARNAMRLENGPRLSCDEGHLTQAQVDELMDGRLQVAC